MGATTSLVVRRDSRTIRVSLRQFDEQTHQPRQLNYDLNDDTTQRNRWDARRFANEYIKLLNILRINDSLPTTKRNIRHYILGFLACFLAIGDSISIDVDRYIHSRREERLYIIHTNTIAEVSRSTELYHKIRNADLTPIEDYLQLINASL